MSKLKSTALKAREITQINAKYHDAISFVYDTYQEQNHPKVLNLYDNFFKDIFTYFDRLQIKKLNILDIGCGTGYLEQFLKPEKHNILGIDVSKKLLAKAKTKYPAVTFRLQDAYSLKDGSYDLVVENSVLHHLKDYETILEKMTLLLKPNGCILLGAEPNYYCYRYLSILKMLVRNIFPDKRKLKTKEVKRKLERFAEYHMYFSDGMNPFEIKKFFLKKGFQKVELILSSREFFAGIIDRMNLRIVDYIPNFLLDSTGLFSRIFYIVAYK